MLMSTDTFAMNQKLKTALINAIYQFSRSFKPQYNGSEQVNGAEKRERAQN